VPFRLRPLSLVERRLTAPTVSLRALLDGDSRVEGTCSVGLRDYVHEITASGFPAIRDEPARARRAELDAYLGNVVSREFPQQGYAVRKPEALRAWLTAYAAATATTASYADILDAATPNESGKPAKDTVGSYREALAALWLLDPLPAWIPAKNYLTRLGQAAKHHLADPALAARLLGLDEASLLTTDRRTLKAGPVLGALFESLIALSVQTYAAAAEARVFHLRTRNGDHEIDLLAQRADGRVVALEVKLSAGVESADARHLAWLRQAIGDDLAAAVIVTTGQHAYTRPDGIAVVPAALLGP
jgi:predicted AAA+ superfamily ATPase